MLKIADDALDTLREIGTIRIRGVEAGEHEVELEIEQADEPVVDDEVVEHEGVRVFLDPVAASALEDQILGIEAHGDHVHFTFDEQPGASDSP